MLLSARWKSFILDTLWSAGAEVHQMHRSASIAGLQCQVVRIDRDWGFLIYACGTDNEKDRSDVV